MPRSMKLRTKARKWARAIASRFSSLQRGKHLARLTRVTLRRSGMSQNTTDPIAAPIAATARNGRKRTSHMNPMKPLPSSRLSTTRASGHFVAVVAPEVLAGTFAHEILERAVEPPGRGFARELFRKGLQPDLVAAAPWQPSAEGEKAAYAFALREPGGEGHGVRRTAEEIGPVAFAFAGHLVGQKADRLAVAQRLEDRAHPAHVGRHEAHVRPVTPFAHERVDPAELGRPVEHGDRHVQRGVLRGNFEAAHVRREEEQRLAFLACGECLLHALHLTHHRHDLGMRPEPQRRQLGEHLPRLSDRRAAGAGIDVAGLQQVGAQVPAIGGRDPINQPPEDGSQRMQQRQRQLPGEMQENAGERQDFGILAPSHKKAHAMSEFLFTSESVSEGHPDKVADQISDAVLDAILAQDPRSRVAAETLVKNNLVVLAGEITTNARVNFDAVARKTIQRIGYTDPKIGFDTHTCTVIVAYGEQSRDIAQGVDRPVDLDQGAGDQGLMFGYACDETPGLMPMAIYLSHRLVERQAEVRRDGRLPWLRPDAKSQVTLRYVNGKPESIDTVVLSPQHAPGIAHKQLEEAVIEHVVKPVLPKHMVKGKIKYLVNPTGAFEIGGPTGDCGLTGRKIIVDTYGGSAPHGGAAFSGKDPSKVDRSAAYAARYVAKNIVAAGLASKCLVQVSYAIGVAQPTSVMVTTQGTGKISDDKIAQLVRANFDLRPKGIIQMLDLLRPIYEKTAAYGHFGREEPEFTWEATDKALALKEAA